MPRRAPTVDRIVRTAVEIADAEGLLAVTMRRVAAALGSGTTSLYRHMTSRNDLLDLMVDEVWGEGRVTLSGEWRADLLIVARRMRAILLGHPWLGAELAGRPAIGANSLCWRELALAAVTSAISDIAVAATIVEVVQAYVQGACSAELAQAQRGDAFPTVARWLIDAEERFEFGLACVLDGVAARIV